MSDNHFSLPSLIAVSCQCGKAYLNTHMRKVSLSGNSAYYHNVFQTFKVLANES